jgi:hypothetical protein
MNILETLNALVGQPATEQAKWLVDNQALLVKEIVGPIKGVLPLMSDPVDISESGKETFESNQAKLVLLALKPAVAEAQMFLSVGPATSSAQIAVAVNDTKHGITLIQEILSGNYSVGWGTANLPEAIRLCLEQILAIMVNLRDDLVRQQALRVSQPAVSTQQPAVQAPRIPVWGWVAIGAAGLLVLRKVLRRGE